MVVCGSGKEHGGDEGWVCKGRRRCREWDQQRALCGAAAWAQQNGQIARLKMDTGAAVLGGGGRHGREDTNNGLKARRCLGAWD
ncbi:hypothetical protein M0R45_005862 [Rubus argutus]|uniref:MHC class I antigen n=1 Tax=Rubus argutus TaxID=59490 RepID=A0AAW1YP42_RUBAR